jgi:hypothetical protein
VRPVGSLRNPRLAGLLAAALLGVALAPPVTAASRTDLDRDWQFRADPEDTGTGSGWMSVIPPDTVLVTVPHTWNVGKLHDYLGVAWYFRRFEAPSGAAHVELHFGATFYRARVWLNGVELGSHEGGFTAYSFDITPHLRRTNVLVVRIDNRPGVATIPGIAARGGPDARYDWWTYGGLVRDVWLTTSGAVWVRRQSIRTALKNATWTVHDRIYLGGAQRAPVSVHVTALGPDNRVAATAEALAKDFTETDVTLGLTLPKLWNIDHPNLYRMVVEVRNANRAILDEDTATFGVRMLEIRDRHLLINGERVRLTGIARHEDSPWEGLAETAGTMRHDLDDMEHLHTTLTRPIHYPQNPFILDYADRHGILLIPEIPLWQFSEAQLSDPRVLELAKQQMREMIEEAGNHPSIFGWSVANESATGTPGGIAYFRAMRAMIHAIDPDRPVSFADDNLPKLTRADQSAANDADFLMMNQYFGSWHGPAEALVPALEKINRLFPDKMVIISEMGFAGIFASNPTEADRARIRIMREQLPVLASRDWIAGAILWCYQDYKSPRNLWPGETEGYVDHGLVDEERQRRPSYAVWKELNAPARIVAHWVGEGAGGSAGGSANAPTGFAIQLTPNSERELPFYPLHDYRLSWVAADGNGKALARGERELPSVSEPLEVTGTLTSTGAAAATARDGVDANHTVDGLAVPAAASAARAATYTLNVTLRSPTGVVAASDKLEWPSSSSAQAGQQK